MKLIKPSYSIIEPTGYTIDDIYKSIELAGKVSHKSEHTIKEGSSKDFVDRMIKLGHGATLEFGTVYLVIPCEFNGNQYNESWKESKYNNNPYSKVRREYVESERNYVDFITTNLRVLVENNWLNDLKYLCEPTEFHEKRVCVKFICDRGILAEFTRHRKFSFMAESTRYCVSGDTLLTYKNPCNHYTIRELWKDKQNKNRLSQILIEVLNIDTGILEYSKIKNIFNNGIRKVYKITTELGYSLKCTSDHQIYTPNDWKSLSELKIGDKIYVNGIEGPIYQNRDWLEYHYLKLDKTVAEICKEFNFKSDVIRKWLHKYNIVKPKLEKQLYQDYDWLYNQNITLNKTFVDIGKEFGINVSTLKKWAKKLGIPNKGTGYFNVGRTPWNKGKTEIDERVAKQANALRTYHHNGDSTEKILKEDTSKYQKYIKSSCEICGTTKDLEVHHKDKNHSNNNPNNLMTVCSSCHQQVHHQSLTSLYGDKIIAITELGEEEVFDLEIENYHNYVANGIIVHNCNYSKDKFDNELTYIKPCWLDDEKLALFDSYHTIARDKSSESIFIANLNNAERDYLDLIKSGWKPEQARVVLPLALKTELYMCGFLSDWENFFILRDDKQHAHPQAYELAHSLHEEFINRKYYEI